MNVRGFDAPLCCAALAASDPFNGRMERCSVYQCPQPAFLVTLVGGGVLTDCQRLCRTHAAEMTASLVSLQIEVTVR